jgi:DNA-directed RNA polymerase subunit RPC12/RpoP
MKHLENLVIGEILENGEIKKGLSSQGEVYKSYPAFYNKTNETCYVGELNDFEYTYKDFLDLANGNEEIAKHIFDTVDWQSPQTYLEEMLEYNDVGECSKCGKLIYLSDEDETVCPFCSTKRLSVNC